MYFFKCVNKDIIIIIQYIHLCIFHITQYVAHWLFLDLVLASSGSSLLSLNFRTSNR